MADSESGSRRLRKLFELLGECTPNGTVITLHRHDGSYVIRADGMSYVARHLPRIGSPRSRAAQGSPTSSRLIGGSGWAHAAPRLSSCARTRVVVASFAQVIA